MILCKILIMLDIKNLKSEMFDLRKQTEQCTAMGKLYGY